MTRCTDTCCMPEVDDIEVIEIASDVFTARKDYTCRWCGGTIEKGTRYRRTVTRVDGVVYNERSHLGGPYCEEAQ